MDFHRARESDLKYIRYDKSFIHSTALMASEGEKIIAVFEYEIIDIEKAEIINFGVFQACEEASVFKGFIDEMNYWSPHLKRVVYYEDKNIIRPETLINSGFVKNSVWILEPINNIDVFKIDIKEIIPEQLTVDRVKLDRVSSWIEKPEDIIVSCVEIDNKIVSIDGHSRLVAAFNKGFKHVYAYLEPNNINIQLYKACLKWCEEQGILTIEDLAKRVVTPEEHERIWISRCQAFLAKDMNK